MEWRGTDQRFRSSSARASEGLLGNPERGPLEPGGQGSSPASARSSQWQGGEHPLSFSRSVGRGDLRSVSARDGGLGNPLHTGTGEASQSHGYCGERGEILGPPQEHPMQTRVTGDRLPIKNESEGIQDDQIPLSSATVNGVSKVPALPSSLDGLRWHPIRNLPNE